MKTIHYYTPQYIAALRLQQVYARQTEREAAAAREIRTVKWLEDQHAARVARRKVLKVPA
jgi:hypothetical protein